MGSVSTRAIRTWSNEGKLKKLGHGIFDFKKALQFLLERDAEGIVSNNQGTEALSDEDMKIGKARLEKAKANMAEAEVGIEKRSLISNADLNGYIVNLITIFKRELLGLSRIMPSYLYGLSEAEMEEKITQHLQKVMWTLFDKTEMVPFIEYLDSLNN